MDGPGLYDIVGEYFKLGAHICGTDVDAKTVSWLTRHLQVRGMEVRHDPVPFERYVADSVLTADGEQIEHLPLFYEWTGTIDTTDVLVELVDVGSGGQIGVLDDVVDTAASTGTAAGVFCTNHPNGSLVAVNRAIRAGSGYPVVLAAGRDHCRLVAAQRALRHEVGVSGTVDRGVRLQMSASIQPALTTNIIARNNIRGEPLMLTTPLTAWVGAAGERGTGIAILLELVERLGNSEPLLVVASGGHELHYLGIRKWTADLADLPRAIVHIGASVAVTEPSRFAQRRLSPDRLAMTNLGGAAGSGIKDALTPARMRVSAPTNRWFGEGEVLHTLGVALLSFTGSGIDFHTLQDTPQRATTPDALAVTAEAIAEAVQVLSASTQPRPTSAG